MPDKALAGCHTIYWYDQYCENYYPNGFKHYSVDSVIEDLDRVDADIYAIYATNQWGIAYYNSAILPTYPPLARRDYFGEVVTALRRRGRKVIAYTNWLDSRHPEWRWQRLPRTGAAAAGVGDEQSTDEGELQTLPEYRDQGKGEVYRLRFGEWFCHCINSPRREEIKQVAEEIVRSYPVDAFHLDMFFNPGVCVCRHCRPQLAALLGTDEITYEKILEHWSAYLSWRHEVSASLIAELGAIVHARGVAFAPNAFCPLYTDPLMAVGPGWWEHVDYYVTEAWLRLNTAYAGIHSSTLVCKWLRALGVPGMLLVTGQHNPLWHTPIAREELRLHAAVAKGNGLPIFGPCGVGAYPSTRSNQEGLRSTRQVFDFYRRDPAAQRDREPVRHIGVVWSEETRNFYEPGEGASRYRFEFLGYCRSLLENQRVFDILLPERLRSLADLDGYQLVILPNVACMSGAQADLVRQYVQRGGRLLCTWDTSLCEPQGKQRNDFLLSDVLGVRYTGRYPSSAFYVGLGNDPVVVLGEAARVAPTSAEVLVRLVSPDPDYPDSGNDLIPGAITDYPVWTRNTFGRGTAWYVAGSVGYSAYKLGHYQTLELLTELIEGTGLARWIEVDAPPTVEVSVERDRAGVFYVHLANKTVPPYLPGRELLRSIDTIVPVADIRVRFLGPGAIRCLLPSDAELAVTQTGAGLECHIPRLHDYLLLEVTLTGTATIFGQ